MHTIFAKKYHSIGGHFPYVNVDIRRVVLSMSTHVNYRGVGGKKGVNFGQRKL